jgi:hypothetical protein
MDDRTMEVLGEIADILDVNVKDSLAESIRS